MLRQGADGRRHHGPLHLRRLARTPTTNRRLKPVSVICRSAIACSRTGPVRTRLTTIAWPATSAGMVLNQPALSKMQWRAEVDKMRTAYKAPIDRKDVDAIVDYLAALKGAK